MLESAPSIVCIRPSFHLLINTAEQRDKDVTLPAYIHEKSSCGIFLNLGIRNKEGTRTPAEMSL